MTPSEPARILDAMILLLTPPEHWIQGNIAGQRLPNGNVLPANEADPQANCFCLVGARSRVDGNDTMLRIEVNQRIIAAIKTLFPDRHSPTGRYNLSTFNDHPATTHRDVLHVLRLARAIAS